jgi:small subunit ribosomal protein S8
MKNYLWNMFANIKNGQLARRAFIFQKKKTICESFLHILWDEGYILGYSIDSNNPDKLKIALKYQNNSPVINTIQVLSKPGSRVYWSAQQLWKIDSGKVFIIISTNKGLKTLLDCKKCKLGGEPILVIR